MERILDRGDGALHVDQQTIGKTMAYRQALGLSPVNDGLLIFFGGAEARVPFLGGQEMMKLGRTLGLELLEELPLLVEVRRLQADGQAQHLSGIVVGDQLGRAILDRDGSLSYMCAIDELRR